MSNMIISYDLRNHRDYTKIQQAIAKLGTASKVLESVWYVQTPFSAIQCRDFLQKNIDSDDGVAVFDCSNNTWATWRCNHEEMKRLWQNQSILRKISPVSLSTSSVIDLESLKRLI